jgi:hypothetical protein
MAGKLAAAASIARLGGHVLREKARPRVARVLSEVPSSWENATAEWFTAALCRDHPGAAVLSVTPGAGSVGTTSRQVLHVTYNSEGTAAGLPSTVFAKSTAAFRSRVVMGLSGGLDSECGFYARIGHGLAIETPTCYHAAFDGSSGRSILLLEDVAAGRGATFGSPTLAVTRPMAESMVRQLAGYHGAFWDSPRLATRMPWLKTSLAYQVRLNNVVNSHKLTLRGIRRSEHLIPRAVLSRAADVYPATMRALELNGGGPQTLQHADVHIGNWYLLPDGRMGQFDWQCTTKGGWALDVSYALMSALAVEDRRSWERDLLALYLDALGAQGIVPPSPSEAWLSYRQQTLHGYMFWLSTLGAGAMLPDLQPRDICLANIARMSAAVDDLDSLNVVLRA